MASLTAPSLLWLLLSVVEASPIAAPRTATPPAPTATQYRRNLGNSMASNTTVTDATPVASTTASAASSTTSSTGGLGNFFGGVSSSLLEWVALVIVVAVILSLLVARYLYVRRFGKPTLRSYLLGPKGLHVPFLGIHIKGPPPRPVFVAPPYRSTRRRRDRTTNGPDIGHGGRRGGGLDGDNGETHELPAYAIDSDLPTYDIVTPNVFHLPGEGSGEAAGATPSSESDEPTPLSVAQYEQQSRAAAHGAATIAVPPPVATPETMARARMSRVPVPVWEGHNEETETRSVAGTSTGSTLAKEEDETDSESMSRKKSTDEEEMSQRDPPSHERN